MILAVDEWEDLSLELGLLYSTLNAIKKENRGDIVACKREMLASWLNRSDNVSRRGGPSWQQLAIALRKINKIPEAENLESTYLKAATVNVVV